MNIEDEYQPLPTVGRLWWLVIGLILFAGLCLAATAASAGEQIHYRNGVACVRKLYPIPGSHESRVVYEPYVAPAAAVVVEKKVEYAPPAYPSENELLAYPDDQYEKALLRIVEKAQKDQSRRADIELLRKLGLNLDGGHSDYSKSVYARSVYDRGYERPAERSFGISVKESVDYIGSDPTDVIADQIGRNIDGVRGLFGDLTGAQSDALKQLIQSRAVNSERIARALETQAESQARANEIRAIGEATSRGKAEREFSASGSFLDALKQTLNQTANSVAGHTGGGSELQQVVTKNCGKCHNGTNSARLDLSDYEKLSRNQVANVIKQVRSGAMPPTGEPALSADDERVIVDDFLARTIEEN